MLTEKQKRFAFEYCKDWNGTKAAIRASYSEAGAGDTASRLLQNSEVLELIEEYKETNARVARLDKNFILNIWMQIATADPTELVKTVVRPCLRCWPAGLVVAEPNPTCELCYGGGVTSIHIADTSKLSRSAKMLYAGAKQTKDGIQILMHDKMEAIKNLANYLGVGNTTQISGPNGGAIQLEAMNNPAELTDAQLAGIVRLGMETGNLGVVPGVDQKALPLTIEGK